MIDTAFEAPGGAQARKDERQECASPELAVQANPAATGVLHTPRALDCWSWAYKTWLVGYGTNALHVSSSAQSPAGQQAFFTTT